MSKYVHSFKTKDHYSDSSLDGKGANLIELFQIEEINVPDGFCITVENATKLIKDGQKIRLNGTKGYIEILSD